MLVLRQLASLVLLLPLPALAAPIGEAGARLLLGRTGFGAPPAQVAALAPLEREAAVDRILASRHSEPATTPPDWTAEPLLHPPRKDLSENEKQALRDTETRRGLALRAWWLQEMATTASPVTEKLTLFWHGHFVSGQNKVKSAQLMYRQNALLRREALGNFASLLHDIARDPAMLRYLDTAGSRKGQANENFAREVMELFTLGEGHYSEQDIREAARAFTGWQLDPDSGEPVFRPHRHDDGQKTVLGHSSALDGDAVLDTLLAQPATSRFITRKLWLYLVSPTPDDATVKRLAASFARDYQIKPLVRALLLTPAFWHSSGQQVKSPVELTVGTVATFGISVPDWPALAQLNRRMGQDLFDPPNVRGWPGGDAWINSDSLLLRKQFLDSLTRYGGNKPRPQIAPDWLQQHPAATSWLPALPAANPLPAPASPLLALRQLLQDPAWQLQ
jgi:uncharacterized protein (DUF1800 family)